MNLARIWKRWLQRWHLPRSEHQAVRPTHEDPADCGTAWGLDLTLPPKAFDRSRSPRQP
ncbi:hypothetical protein [Methylibium sp.]|uniref:hypothetical protein n=1 Tax=Methylibium sp. TaxID=2067992 RepID=UPI003D0EED2A